MEGKTALFHFKYLCCKFNNSKIFSTTASSSLRFNNDYKCGILRSTSKVSTSKTDDNDINNNNNNTPSSIISGSINTPSVHIDPNDSNQNLGNTNNPQTLLQTMFGNKQKLSIYYSKSSNDSPNSIKEYFKY